MEQCQFTNSEITDQFISANADKNNNYPMVIGAENLYTQLKQNTENNLYKEFRSFAPDYLDRS